MGNHQPMHRQALFALFVALFASVEVKGDCTCDRQVHAKLQISSASPLRSIETGILQPLINGLNWNNKFVLILSADLESDDDFLAVAGGSKSAGFSQGRIYPQQQQSVNNKEDDAQSLSITYDGSILLGKKQGDSVGANLRVRVVVSGADCSSDDLTGLIAQLATSDIEVLQSVEDFASGKCGVQSSNQCPCLNGGSCSSWQCSCPRFYMGRACEGQLVLRDMVAVIVQLSAADSCLSWQGFPFDVRQAMDNSGVFTDTNPIFKCAETGQGSYFIVLMFVPVHSGYGLGFIAESWAMSTFSDYATETVVQTKSVLLDCAGVPGGISVTDACGDCDGNDSCFTEMSSFANGATVASPSPSTPSTVVSPQSSSQTSVDASPVVSVAASPMASRAALPTHNNPHFQASRSPSPHVEVNQNDANHQGPATGVTIISLACSATFASAALVILLIHKRQRRSRVIARASPMVVATDLIQAQAGATIVINVVAVSK